MPDCDCPACRANLSAATGFRHDSKPKPGDASICAACGALLFFTRKLRLRLPTNQETREAAHDKNVALAQWAINQKNARRLQ